MNEATPAANSQSAKTMKQLIFEIVQALVDIPDAVSVEVIEDRESTVLRVRVAPQDIGKVIGKQGRTARSLRTILGAASMKLHHRFSLDILEDDEEDDLEDDQQPARQTDPRPTPVQLASATNAPSQGNMNHMQSASQWIVLARILRPQGRKGEVLADLFTDFPGRFVRQPRVWLAPQGFADSPSAASTSTEPSPPLQLAEVASHWLPLGKNAGRIVLRFVTIDSIELGRDARGQRSSRSAV